MRGIQRVVIQNKKIKYDFELKRNITVIRGDSATGKTALVDMIREYYENGVNSGIELNCTKTCVVLEGKSWKLQLSMLTDSIVFIDEGNPFVASKEFAAAISHTDNYYVIVTRESLATLPYSVSEIYGIRNAGKYGRLKQTYNEMYQLYSTDVVPAVAAPEAVLVEDSHAGYQFFHHVCTKNEINCKSADGKSNVFGLLEGFTGRELVVIADGAAFGPEMEKVMKQVQLQGNVSLYLPESFEWLILSSGIVKDKQIEQILKNPSEYIDGKEFLSWERYFVHFLIDATKDTYLKYNKATLNPVYTQSAQEEKILAQVKMVDFSWKNE